jgi:SAM-dependent methyltransferase/thioredoxin reductase
MSRTTARRIAVIGAGPVGLAAAAHLVAKGETPLVLEAGDSVGTHVLAWGHVQVFSPWRYNVDAVAGALLRAAGWKEPDPERLPTGAEIVAEYLRPLAVLPQIAPHIRLGTRVVAIARSGHDKMKTPGRDAAPFELLVTGEAGESTLVADAVIDASGTYGVPNPLGANGLAVIGEPRCRRRIMYGIPDALGVHRARYAGRRILVVGSGHSAFNALLDLEELAITAPDTTITWAVRRSEVGAMYGGGAADALPARSSLGARVRALVESRRVRLVTGFLTAELRDATAAVTVIDAVGRALGPFDEIVAVTGFRPDLAMLRELRLDLDAAIESPRALAPLIDPNLHSCGTVPPHGVDELRHPEPGFFIVGMKSYGRAPTFLMLTGYEQVRSVVAELTGDVEAARRVELTLPATGVCSSTPASGVEATCCTVSAAATEAGACCEDSLTVPAGAACCAPEPAESTSACCGSTPMMVTMLGRPEASAAAARPDPIQADTIKSVVKDKYAAAALRVSSSGSSCCGGSGPARERDLITSNLYGAETADLPAEAVAASLGCGNPTALAELRRGEVVLDLGSGGGIDVLLSARRVGPTGKAYGLDMTDEMLALARENQRKAGVDNVEFLKGEIEHVPLPDEAIDVIISNCVINLSADKDAVLAEAFRVLKPGGRLAVSDVVVRGEVPAAIRRSVELWIGCVAGALEESEYRAKLGKAGFETVEVEPTRIYRTEDARGALAKAGLDADAIAPAIDGKFMSAFIRARKPTR